jgi:diguanylate cyclase (GGDEF)-like protein/PAS domain S-box-containing protein
MFGFIQRLIGTLSVSRKLVLIYVLDLSAVIFVSSILINEKFIAIDFARKEIAGNAYISAVRDIILPIRAPAPDGGAERVLDAEREHGRALGSHDLALQLADKLRLAEKQPDPTPWRAQRLAPAMQALVTRIGNHSNLILDPDLDSYYTMSLVVLRFPELFDVAARLAEKALAVRLANSAEIRRQRQTEYLIVEGRLDALTHNMASDYAEAVAAGDSALKRALDPSRGRLLAAIEALRTAARREALSQSDGDSEPEIRKGEAAVMDSLRLAWDDAGTALDGLLVARIDRLFSRMWWHLGAAALLLLVILSVVYFVARMIALPIRRLATVAGDVSRTADYSLRANWTSGDELGRLVDAFNSMLGQLDRFRLVQQELAASARAAAAQRELLEAIPMPLMVTAIPKHEILHANAPALEWLQDRSADPWLRGLTRPMRAQFFQQLADRGRVDEFEALWHGQGEDRWALLSARRLNYQDQDAVLTTFAPIGRIKQMESRLELWAKVFEASSESIMVTNAEREIVTVNRAFLRTTSFEYSEVIGRQPDFLRSGHHSDNFFEQVWGTARARGSWQGEQWIRRKNGETFPIWVVINAVRNARGEVIHFVATFLDISERKDNERRISHLAHHDTLTDLPNRALCLDRLNMAVQQAKRSGRRVGVLFMDLDRFKSINDTLGHHVGDGLLRSVAKRLLEVVRSGDTVSRLGGDEFVVVFSDIDSADEVAEIVEKRLVPAIRAPHLIDGVELNVSCSVGVAVFPENGETVDILMRNADAAMYHAKEEGRNNAQFFTAEMDKAQRERLQIEQDLHNAVERNELRLHYQPRVDALNGDVVAVEALVRWQHPTHGLVPPGQFIAVAEECGLIVPIGYWVIQEACRQQAEWRDGDIGDIRVSINLSAAQFQDEGLVEGVAAILKRHRNNPGTIEFELTESLLMIDRGRTIDQLRGIKALGVSLSIDDFGTGYSSLNYLYRFPIDKLKIDQSFVSDMLSDPKDYAITQAIIGLGHTLGLKVVGEGVETIEQRFALASAGCDELQGYYFSRPIPADDLPGWVSVWADNNQAIELEE